MSLESELAQLNATLKELIVALARPGVAIPTTEPEPAKEKTTKPKKEKAAEPEKAPDAKTEVVERTADTDRAEAEPVIQALLNAGKKADILALNAEFGVKRFGELCGTDKFPAYLAKARKLNGE